MSCRRYWALCVILLVGGGLSGCYHATIHTGLEPSSQTVGDKWASGWVYGIVPPKPLDASEECENGVARVDTQQSFTNGLVGMLTLGIYTPMEVLATCATGGGGDQSSDQGERPEGPEKR